MRASRAYIAGLGTTGVLLASSVLLLFVVGTVVAFNSSSVSDGIRELEGLVVDRGEPTGLSGPALAAAEAAPAAGGVSARPPASAVPLRATASTTGPLAQSSVASAGAPAGAGAAPQASPGGRTFRSPGSTRGGRGDPQQTPDITGGGGAFPTSDLGRSQKSLGKTTQEITDGVGRVVDGVDPRLGETVKGLGKTTGQLVDGLTGGLTGAR